MKIPKQDVMSSNLITRYKRPNLGRFLLGALRIDADALQPLKYRPSLKQDQA
jgi:hypothetical protein